MHLGASVVFSPAWHWATCRTDILGADLCCFFGQDWYSQGLIYASFKFSRMWHWSDLVVCSLLCWAMCVIGTFKRVQCLIHANFMFSCMWRWYFWCVYTQTCMYVLRTLSILLIPLSNLMTLLTAHQRTCLPKWCAYLNRKRNKQMQKLSISSNSWCKKYGCGRIHYLWVGIATEMPL